MADLEAAKLLATATWPPKGKESPWLRTEPLLEPDDLRALHLFGLSLVSQVPDPETGKRERMTNELLKEYIERAVTMAEQLTHATIMPTQYDTKEPFDQSEWRSNGFFRLAVRPIWAIKSLTIQLSNGEDVFTVPKEWIDVGQLYKGQINLMPYVIGSTGSGAVVPAASGAGLAMLQAFGASHWIGSWWHFEVMAGFPDGMVPKVVNDLIGTIAAIDILSMLAATYAQTTGHSIGIDGLSESFSGPGPQVYLQRITDLEKKRDALVGKIKAVVGQKLFAGNV